MTAPVRIEAEAWSDLRFATLARLLGLADLDHALIKVGRIWSWQAEHYTPDEPTYVVDADLIESALGAGGAAAMVRARLAEEEPGGFRIRGTRGRIEWLFQRRQASAKGGEARKRSAADKREPSGYPGEEPGHEPKPSPLVPALVLPDQRSEPSPACAIPPDPVPVAPAPTAIPAPGPGVDQIAQASPDLVHRPTTNTPDEIAREARQRVRLEIRAELELARRDLAAELDMADHGLLAQDPGERELAMHLVHAGPTGLAAARGQALHAIAMAKLEARRDRSLRWLTGAIFAERNFRRLVAMTAEEARRADPIAKGATSTPARRRKPTNQPIPTSTLTPEERLALAAEARSTLGIAEGARAPPTSTRPNDDENEQPQPRTAT